MRKHLIIVDVQNDFIEGSLGVERGNMIIPIINKLTNSGIFDTVVATQDWHPNFHCSYKIWPSHCLQGYWGAELHNDLDQSNINMIFRKGMDKDVDSYSAFYDNGRKETGLGRFYIPSADNDDEFDNEFYICGIATEVCVKATALDCKEYFGSSSDKVIVIIDACASLSETSFRESFVEMSKAGIEMLFSGDILK